MAEAVVSKVLRNLTELVAQEAIFLFGVREKFEWVKSELEWIKSFLRDADAKEKKDERVKNWVNEVIDVSYQAEDAIDSFLLLIRHTQFPCFLDCLTSITPYQLMERHRIGVEIDRIKDRINMIKSRRQDYGIQSLGEDAQSSVKISVRRRRLPSQPDHVDMVGHSGARKNIVKQLINQRKQQLCFTCIYGTGGLGKTTLARKIFQSDGVQRHFPVRIWMVVTHYSASVELLAQIIKEVTSEEITDLKGMEVENFTEKMKESLGDQEKRCLNRCLIVLDDVWEEHKDVCGLVRRLFRSVMNGSRVLVTTRSKEIAIRTDTSACPYQLPFLDEDESVALLLKNAFPYQDDVETTSCPKELVDLAPLLAKRCRGLPLALSVLGSHLSVKEKTPRVWMNLAEKMNWASQGRECQEILALSYEALEYDLKPCFLYLGVFPQGHVISASLLVKLWVAEGLVEDEEKGDVVLEELIHRSLVQVNERRPDGSVKKCGVHDLLLELAKDEAENNGFLRVCTSEVDIRAISRDRHTRRVAFQGGEITDKIDSQTVVPGLRTLMRFHSFFKEASSLLFRSEFLRVIVLQNVTLQPPRLPAEIESMKLLRYLGLRGTGVKELPTSIGELQNLQTIDLRGCKDCIIPSALFKIKTLRHVQTEMTLRPPPNLVLYDIKTLERVAITGSSNWVPKWKFPKLQKLSLTEVERFHGRALVTVLAELNHLVVLKIAGECIPSEVDLMAFEFHRNLRYLRLCGKWPRGDAFDLPSYLTKIELEHTELELDPMPKLERLHYLVYVKLSYSAYVGKTMTCSAGGFPLLQRLEISHLTSLEEWKVEEGAMPKLKQLEIGRCSKLKMFPDLQHVPNLELRTFGMPGDSLYCPNCTSCITRRVILRIPRRRMGLLVSGSSVKL